MSACVAIIKCHKLGGLGNRNLFSPNFRRLPSPRLDVLGIRVSDENPLPGSQSTTFLLCIYMAGRDTG